MVIGSGNQKTPGILTMLHYLGGGHRKILCLVDTVTDIIFLARVSLLHRIRSVVPRRDEVHLD